MRSFPAASRRSSRCRTTGFGPLPATVPRSSGRYNGYARTPRLLVTLLVGNNLVNIAVTSIVTLLVARFLPPGTTVVIATVSVSVLVLVFGEIVPKSYGLGRAEAWSRRVARPVALVERALWPVVTAFEITTQWPTTPSAATGTSRNPTSTSERPASTWAWMPSSG